MIFHIKQYDTTLLTFEYENKGLAGHIYEVLSINEEKRHLLPKGLDLTQENGILSWLKRRIVPKNRAYVDTMLARMGYSQKDTIGIIKLCKGLSVIDSYWVVEDDFDGKFADFNLFENAFETALALVAYTGYGSIKAHGFTSSPEFTTNGMLPKAWRRLGGKVSLYKGGTSGVANAGNEPYSEFYAAQVAQSMGLNNVSYGLSRWKKNLCSTCELFTNIDTSYVHIYDFAKKVPILNMPQFMKDLNEQFYETNEPLSFAPLFDHGMSLFNYAMDDDLSDVVKYSQTRSSNYDIPFLELAKDFITDKQKTKLRKISGFTFTRHSRYNLPAKRLRAIEKFLQHRKDELLALPSV